MGASNETEPEPPINSAHAYKMPTTCQAQSPAVRAQRPLRHPPAHWLVRGGEMPLTPQLRFPFQKFSLPSQLPAVLFTCF